mgnify:CR=1 FL=1
MGNALRHVDAAGKIKTVVGTGQKGLSGDGGPALDALKGEEAGLHAVRANRYVILPKDFEKAYKNNIKRSDTEFDFYS